MQRNDTLELGVEVDIRKLITGVMNFLSQVFGSSWWTDALFGEVPSVAYARALCSVFCRERPWKRLRL